MGELVWEAEEKKWTGALRSVSLSLLWVSPALPCKSLGIYLYNCISASLITSISVSLPGPCGSVCVQCLSLRGGISFFPKQVEGCLQDSCKYNSKTNKQTNKKTCYETPSSTTLTKMKRSAISFFWDIILQTEQTGPLKNH